MDLSLIHAADKQKAELLEENQRELNECRKQLEQVRPVTEYQVFPTLFVEMNSIIVVL